MIKVYNKLTSHEYRSKILNTEGAVDMNADQNDTTKKAPPVVRLSLPVSNQKNNLLQKYQSLRNHNIIINNYANNPERNENNQNEDVNNIERSVTPTNNKDESSKKDSDRQTEVTDSLNKTTASQLFN